MTDITLVQIVQIMAFAFAVSAFISCLLQMLLVREDEE